MKKVLAVVAIVITGSVVLSIAHATTVTGTPSVGNITTSSAQVSWVTDIASDSQANYGTSPSNFSGYSASRCDLGGNILAHCVNLTGLTANTLYYYKVSSCVSGGGCGDSTTYTFTTSSGGGGSGGGIPTDPSSLRGQGTPTSSSIPLAWNDNSDNESKWNLYRSLAGANSWTQDWTLTTPNLTTYTDTTVAAGTSYDYRIQACQEGYGCSGYAYVYSLSSASAGDTTAPSAPTGFVATGASASQINLTWTASTDNVGVTGYKIYRAGTLITTVTTTSYSDTGLAASMSYSYTVKAVDAANNESGSATASGTTLAGGSSGDTTAPTAPTGLGAASMSSSQINLTWTASTDNVGVTGYKIYRNGTYVLTVTTTNHNETTLAAGTTYSYYVKAVDAVGNESTASATISASTLTSSGGGSDTTAPTTPTGLVATKDVYNEVDLSWTASTDNVGVSMYHILRSQNGVWSYIGQTVNTTYIDLTVTPSTPYYYAVKAYDAAGYYSATSTALFLNTPASSVQNTTTSSFPSSPSNIVAYFVSNGSFGVSTNLSWTDSVNETSYRVYERPQGGSIWNLAKIRTSTTVTVDAIYVANTTWAQVLAYSSGTYEYKVSACTTTTCSDSPNINVVMGTVSNDTTAPTAPTSVSYTAQPTTLAFTWSGATDNVGVVGYKVYRNETYLKTVADPLCTDTGLSPGTQYSYYLIALDAVGNSSPATPRTYAMTLSSTTTTTTGGAPTAPSSLRGSGSPTLFSVSLVWNDNSANEDKWNLERSVKGANMWTTGWQLSTPNLTSYTDTSVTSGTYYDYRIQACRSGYGCSAYTYVYGLTTSGATNTTATTTSPTLNTSGGASVFVVRGFGYCEASEGKTPLTFSVAPYGAAFFKITKLLPTSANTMITPGTYSLPNGTYRWDAVAYTGYTLSGKVSEELILDQKCAVMTNATTTTATTQLPAPNIEPYIILKGESLVRVPYGGVYTEIGATGYYADGSIGTPKRLLGGLSTTVAGTYAITYQLLDSSGVVVASAIRKVVVDPPLVTKTEPIPTTPDVVVQPVVAPFVPVTSAEEIITQEQYARYCDDPKHSVECQSYANQKIIPVVTTQAPTEIVVITQEQFVGVPVAEVFHEASLPATITDAKQLNGVCAQAEYVTSCTEFLVEQKVLSQAEAESQVKQVFAEAEEVTKIFTERVGSRVFEDTDNDGITNYDEVNIYRTNPKIADTNKDGIHDGAQLLLGEDPAALKGAPVVATSTVPTIVVSDKKVAYEDPRFAGNVKKDLFVEPTINAEPVPPSESAPEAKDKSKIRLGGRALPNSFVTIYLFSEPIVVTVKTDASGSWTYTLDKELPDGNHEMYTAITDTGGRILAKSDPLPFVKTAAAVSFGSPELLPPQNKAPGFFSGPSLYVLIVVLVGALGLALLLIGLITRKNAMSMSDAGGESKKE